LPLRQAAQRAGQQGKRGVKQGAKLGVLAGELHHTPLELIARFAPLVPSPLLWDEAHAARGECEEGTDALPDWDEACQAAPDFEVDQCISPRPGG
jgi:hypothetical protein